MSRILCPEFVSRAAKRGLSQRQVAEACGVSQPAITNFKRRHSITFKPPSKTGHRPIPEPKEVDAVVEAYDKREKKCGGFENADVELCITLAAADCYMSYPTASKALREHWARYMRAG